MSILIKGMEMPKNCNKCPLHFYEGQGICSCRALSAIDDDEILKPWKNKRKDCPLFPVPPHGDLIDRDALIKDGWKLHKEVMRMGGYAIHEKPLINPSIPVIIEAETCNKPEETCNKSADDTFIANK